MRILPRLREIITRQRDQPKVAIPRCMPERRQRRRTSLYKPVPPVPSLHPADYTQSILLAEGSSPNPITESNAYVRHKTLPPRVLPLQANQRTADNSEDAPREMTREELSWNADPYLRMLASPVRRCAASERYFPSDFLIRLVPMRVNPRSASSLHPGLSRIVRTLVPDGVEHSKFKPRRSGRGGYVLCWKEAIAQMTERNSHKRIMPGVVTYSRLEEHISTLLRVRILQEFALLVDSVKSRVPSAGMKGDHAEGGRAEERPAQLSRQDHTSILRRLTRDEWRKVKATGVLPYPDAVALLVVPPLNRDPQTRKRPEPSVSPLPTGQDDSRAPVASQDTSPPLSALYPATRAEDDFIDDDTLPCLQIPLYNGLTLFPYRPHRAALYSYLTQLLSIERRVLSKVKALTASQPQETLKIKLSGDDREPGDTKAKASHAFLLCSNADTITRGDSAAVGIALWRLRMYEGFGWQSENTRRWVSDVSRKRVSGFRGQT
ncbi:hypothetical protein HGRIS_009685 [Hohenbuehelia grisea]|uniref:Uncharacterized protein n=1 Tax=Hohenbuehelia grisea TaxID=104357 RepID=A0ABR3J282_9AGAR